MSAQETREVNSRDAVTVAELSDLLGVSEARIRHCKALDGFPKSVGTIPKAGGGIPTCLYSYREVLKFFAELNDGKTNKMSATMKTNLFNQRATAFLSMKLL